jgi:hypothetical protein
MIFSFDILVFVAGILRNTLKMQMLELLEHAESNTHTCSTPMAFLLMSSTSPHPPSQPSYLMLIPLQPAFSPPQDV